MVIFMGRLFVLFFFFLNRKPHSLKQSLYSV